LLQSQAKRLHGFCSSFQAHI